MKSIVQVCGGAERQMLRWRFEANFNEHKLFFFCFKINFLVTCLLVSTSFCASLIFVPVFMLLNFSILC